MTEHDNPIDEPDIELDAHLRTLLGTPDLWASPPDDLGERIVAAVRSEATLGESGPTRATAQGSAPSTRRGRPWIRPALFGAAAAVVLLFGGLVVLSALSGVDDVDTFAADLTSTGLLADVAGTIEVTSFESGVRVDLDASNLPRRDNGAFYQGWLKTTDGGLVPIGTFHDGAEVTLWAGVELDRVEQFTITLEVVVAADDPGQGSSGEVVLRAELGS